MLAIQPSSLNGAEEELRSVGVRACIGHGQDARTGMLQLEILVSEFRTINGFTTSTVVRSEISSLAHEVRNHAVKL